MSEKPLVSIVIPTYNRAHLIGETIQSVMDQTYANWELTIVDDGSEDETKHIVSQFPDDRISYIRLPHTGSLAKLRNHGINNSSGAYIALLDSDDLWLEEKLTAQMDLLEQHPEAAFVFGNVIFFDDVESHSLEFEELFVGNTLLPVILGNRFLFRPSTLIFRKDIIPDIGMMDESLMFVSEMDFFYRMSKNRIGIFTNKKLVKIRNHPQNISKIKELMLLSYTESIKIAKQLLKQDAITTSHHNMLLKKYYYKMGYLGLENNEARIAYQCFLKYIRISPFHWKAWVRIIQSGALILISGRNTH